MPLEHLVEDWIDDYEAKGRDSALFKLVKSSVELTTPKKKSKHSWKMLVGAASSMLDADSPQKLVADYLLWRLPNWRWKTNHRKANLYTLIDELYVLFYLQGQLPRIVNSEKVYLSTPEQLELMRVSQAHLEGKLSEQREDIRFYRLMARTMKKKSRTFMPSWTALVDKVFQFGPVRERYSGLESFSAYLKTVNSDYKTVIIMAINNPA